MGFAINISKRTVLFGIHFLICAAKFISDNSVILFVGDSITDGERHRSEIWGTYKTGSSYPLFIAAEIGSQWERNVTFFNTATAGEDVFEIEGRVRTDLKVLKPTIISILTGINDLWIPLAMNQTINLTSYETRYENIIQMGKAYNPDMKFVFVEPFILPGPESQQYYNGFISGLAELKKIIAKFGDKYQSPIVKIQEPLDEVNKLTFYDPENHWLFDGIHPTRAGQFKIAQLWMKTLNESFRSDYKPIFKKEAKVLYNGDSVTDGNRFRIKLQHHKLGIGYASLIAGADNALYPELNVAHINLAYAGNAIESIAYRVVNEVKYHQTTVLSLLMGASDVLNEFNARRPCCNFKEITDIMDSLFTRLKADYPTLEILLGLPFCLHGTTTDQDWEYFKNGFDKIREITTSMAVKYSIPIVNYTAVFEDALKTVPRELLAPDGILPTPFGNLLMANEWRRVYAESYPHA